MSATVSYVSRPTLLIAGGAQESLAENVRTVTVEETTEGLSRCEAHFENYGLRGSRADFLFFGRDVLDFGKEFAVRLGYGESARTVFRGRISALEARFPTEGGAVIVALAEDRLQDLRLTRRTRTFEDASDEDVIRRIAAEHGLTPHLTLTGPTHRALAQVNQSDLAFIRERARAVNAELWLDDTTLYAATRPDRAHDPINLEYRANLQAFSVCADLAHQCTAMVVTGWDVSAKDAIAEEAGANALGAELGGTLTGGGDILSAAFGARTERVVHTVPLTSAEARGVAEARYRERARRFITGSGIADGDARMRVGLTVNLAGVGSLFNGAYALVGVRHRYDLTHGYRTEFDVERPGLGPPATANR